MSTVTTMLLVQNDAESRMTNHLRDAFAGSIRSIRLSFAGSAGTTSKRCCSRKLHTSGTSQEHRGVWIAAIDRRPDSVVVQSIISRSHARAATPWASWNLRSVGSPGGGTWVAP